MYYHPRMSLENQGRGVRCGLLSYTCSEVIAEQLGAGRRQTTPSLAKSEKWRSSIFCCRIIQEPVYREQWKSLAMSQSKTISPSFRGSSENDGDACLVRHHCILVSTSDDTSCTVRSRDFQQKSLIRSHTMKSKSYYLSCSRLPTARGRFALAADRNRLLFIYPLRRASVPPRAFTTPSRTGLVLLGEDRVCGTQPCPL